MDPTIILIAAALAVFIFFQFRSAKRRKSEAEERVATIVPGVEVMTQSGIFGTLVSIDEEENFAFVEIAPKVIVKLHTQAIRNAVVPVVDDDSADEPDSLEPELNTSSAVPMAEPETEPEFGERTKKPSRKKPSSDTE
jgi:preprotein translocase subunit YajC